MESKNYNRTIFAIYFNQPFHKSVQQLKVISVVAILFVMYLIWDMWNWFKGQTELPVGWDVAFWGMYATLIGIFWKAIQHIQDKTHIDKHED